eukprot:1269724-Amphidinium_carterae.1
MLSSTQNDGLIGAISEEAAVAAYIVTTMPEEAVMYPHRVRLNVLRSAPTASPVTGRILASVHLTGFENTGSPTFLAFEAGHLVAASRSP